MADFDPTKFIKPDEPHPTLKDFWISFPVDLGPRTYFLTTKKLWFAASPSEIMADLGFSTEKKKLANILDLAEGWIELWYYLALMPRDMRAEFGEEWVNIILGPVAATLKVRGLDFGARFMVIDASGLIMLFEAMRLGMIPPGMRKPLYEALIARYNTEFFALIQTSEWKDTYRLPPKWTHYAGSLMFNQPNMYERLIEPTITSEQAARIIFYGILTDVLAPIWDEASGGELDAMIDTVLIANPKQAGEAKTDPKVVGWIMGQVMRASPTKLDPNTVRAALLERL
jgi:hypothetical protein